MLRQIDTSRYEAEHGKKPTKSDGKWRFVLVEKDQDTKPFTTYYIQYQDAVHHARRHYTRGRRLMRGVITLQP